MSDDLQTVNPDQVPVITTLAPDAFVFVQAPGGPIQKLAYSSLLVKLIAAGLVKADEPTLQADLAWDEDTVALVDNDPDPFKCGWYRKTGASGAGEWLLFEQLAKAVLAGAQAAAAVVNAYTDAGAASLIDYDGRNIAEALADIEGRFLVSMEHGRFSHAVIDEARNVLAFIERTTGRWKVALTGDADIPSGVVLGSGVSINDIDVLQTGWLLPIYDMDKNLLGGWRRDGKLRAVLDDKSVIPAGVLTDGINATLQSRKAGLPNARAYFSGDSLTAGTGGAGTNYPAVAAAALGLDAFNSAYGGTQSGSIAVRQGGLAMNLTLAASLPADTSEVAVTAYSEEFANDQGVQSWNGTLAGIAVVLTRYGVAGDAATTDHYTVARQTAAAAATAIPAGTPFLADWFDGNELDFHYIQCGRNNPRTTHAQRILIRDHILLMVDRLGHDRFGVLPVKNGGAANGAGTLGYDQIMETNRLIEEAVGWHFCDTRSYLASYAALDDAGIAPTSQDDADIAADGIPESLRYDTIHGNAAYYSIEGAFVARWHRGKGWFHQS